MNKIPFEYHLLKMMKSNSVESYIKHAEHFLQQQFIQGSFELQEMLDRFYNNWKLVLN